MTQPEPTTWVCRVPVTSVWTHPDKVREVDAQGVADMPDINKWREAMNQQETKDLTESNRLQTQLLYGEPVLIEEIDGTWAKIIAPWQPSHKDERGYPGWVPLAHLKELGSAADRGYARVTADKAQLWSPERRPVAQLPFNSLLPVKDADESRVHVHTPDGDAYIEAKHVQLVPSPEQIPLGTGQSIVNAAERFLGLQYFWGGMSSLGYDCSGFSHHMLKANGLYISRDAGDQSVEGKEIDYRDSAAWKTGDLLFFAYEEGQGKLHHVGIYYGDGMMIHSPTSGKAIEITRLEGTVYDKELCAVRRFTQEETT
ncbi:MULTISPECIES: C40 family peptidase [unclassified Planococcus (in: firmicutes)]|uniref:C40 family peptidase n=1 Tax=unclassified Planococcus (in: firmicutes) TaxID=2662419 RepID=UPI000C32E914|nr:MULTISPECIES: C40 family peptidase [unclassified Planococcus (in: firmicutes)]AUD14581.1 polysugar degrading enzyme [Planococcus sp. MB-3u-03]PKG44877.1 polysugar degrading enzyme [Planococcus sp. Urea-trap-24]PKG87220.1 polysugar degrading enzyme [Planococcus sp. Urea-3u-39]PKH42345.1 polysugar degrading enzyme [Planococcus sp. MB-3u-09]